MTSFNTSAGRRCVCSRCSPLAASYAVSPVDSSETFAHDATSDFGLAIQADSAVKQTLICHLLQAALGCTTRRGPGCTPERDLWWAAGGTPTARSLQSMCQAMRTVG